MEQDPWRKAGCWVWGVSESRLREVVRSIRHVLCVRQGQSGAEVPLLNEGVNGEVSHPLWDSLQGGETTFWEKGGLDFQRPHIWLTSFQSPWTCCAHYWNRGFPAAHPRPGDTQPVSMAAAGSASFEAHLKGQILPGTLPKNLVLIDPLASAFLPQLQSHCTHSLFILCCCVLFPLGGCVGREDGQFFPWLNH